MTEAEKHAQAQRARATFAALDAETDARAATRAALRALMRDAVTTAGKILAESALLQFERGWARGH